MTPAEHLRAAAKVARETAEAATPGPWSVAESPAGYAVVRGRTEVVVEASVSTWDAAHIALWSPPVALAVAAWLDFMSEAHEDDYLKGSHALAVADALLNNKEEQR